MVQILLRAAKSRVRPRSSALGDHETNIYKICSLDGRAAVGAVATDLKAGDQHAKAAILFDLLFQFLEAVAHKFRDLAAAETRHVDVIAFQAPLVVMSLAIDVHQIEFVDHAVPFQKAKRAIDRTTVDAGVQFLRLAQDLAGIEVLTGGFHHAEDSAALLGHPDSAFGKLGLQASRHFSLRQWHKDLSRSQLVAISVRRILRALLDRNTIRPAQSESPI